MENYGPTKHNINFTNPPLRYTYYTNPLFKSYQTTRLNRDQPGYCSYCKKDCSRYCYATPKSQAESRK